MVSDRPVVGHWPFCRAIAAAANPRLQSWCDCRPVAMLPADDFFATAKLTLALGGFTFEVLEED